MLHVLELLGDEPLAVHQGLLADIGVGHQVVIGLGDLDVIPEHLVVAHLQVLDAGLFPLRLFDGGHHGLAVGHDVPEVVHVAIVARFDEAALPDGEGRLLHQRPGNVLPQVLEVVDGLPQDREQGGAERSEERPEPGQLPQAAGEGHQVPGPCGAVNDAPDEPLQVRHLPEALGDLLPGDGVPHQILHGVQALVHLHRGEEGPLHPGADEPVPHSGAGLVQHPEEGALLLLAAHGLGELQISPGGKVQLHKLPPGVVPRRPICPESAATICASRWSARSRRLDA